MKAHNRFEGWASIDARCKPSKAVAPNGLRPALENGWVSHEKDGSFLCMTDSYICVRLPIAFDGDSIEKREAALPTGPIRREALKALDRSRTGYFRSENGYIEIFGEPMLYPAPSDVGEFPNTRALFPAAKEKGQVSEFGVNPMLMRRTAEALGAVGVPLKMKFLGPLRPVVVQAVGVEGLGLIMPVRLA